MECQCGVWHLERFFDMALFLNDTVHGKTYLYMIRNELSTLLIDVEVTTLEQLVAATRWFSSSVPS